MDRKSWPWRKKSSEKTVAAADTNGSALASSGDAKTDQDDTKTANYVQISAESYAHLTELENQVVILNESISSLNEKLAAAHAEMITKDNLVKQHAKVAEEAVSGWEKAEAEALALKQQLESVTLLKLSAENRASHLDGALKECMKQVRTVREDGEQKLHDVILAKTKQWEKIKAEMEAKFVDFEQELLRSSADNESLSRTLQERSNLLIKISDEKSQANAEIEVLKNDIHSCEREITSLKYELHVLSKENEIRNEEKNISMRSAEVANKQHLEDVKKIAKLEAECQRLRGLVRKKLPGPAALAQMKLEVDSLGRDYGETRSRRSAKSSHPHHLSPSDFALENMHQYRKENEFLTARMLDMEEEMKMLKEALTKRNSELEASRSMYAETANKLQVPTSLTSLSENGIDDEGSCAESSSTALVSELPHVKRGKHMDKDNKADYSDQLELMDDFLEMEKLACMSAEANGSIIVSDVATENLKTDLIGVEKDGAIELDSCVQKECNEDTREVTENFIVQELKDAISQIHDFVMSVGKEATEVSGLTERIEEFSTSVNKVLRNELSLNDFILTLSRILSETQFANHKALSAKGNIEVEYSTDCVDKVTLLENKVPEFEHAKEEFSGVCIPSSHSSTELEIEGPNNLGFELTSTSHKCSLEEFEQLKQEKEHMEMDFAKCREMLELTNHQLVEIEQNLSELKSQLAASEKSNSLAETQLKCMAESYKLLETQKKDLETELILLHTRVEELDKELHDEKQSHQNDLIKYKELQDEIERRRKCLVCSVNSDADGDTKIQQEKEIAAAAEKLAECQETIFLLGKQLNALRPASESMCSSPDHTTQRISDAVLEDNPASRMLSPQCTDQSETENISNYTKQSTEGESPLNGYNSHSVQSIIDPISSPTPPLNSKHHKHRSSRSSSTSSSLSLNEKQGRGFSRFFSKGKNEH